METRVITIPFDRDKGVFEDEQYRKFIMNKEIRSSRPEFFQVGTKAYWTVFLEYELVLEAEPSRAGSPTLSEPEKFFFDKLRVWRKEKAEREGIPTYVIATNSELMEVIKKAPASHEALRSIKGFGKKKIDRHGKEIIDMVKAFHAEKPVYGPKGEQGHDR